MSSRATIFGVLGLFIALAIAGQQSEGSKVDHEAALKQIPQQLKRIALAVQTYAVQHKSLPPTWVNGPMEALAQLACSYPAVPQSAEAL